MGRTTFPSIARLQAMANQVRLAGGQGREQLLAEVALAMAPLQRQLRELEDVQRKAETPLCTIKDGFAIPEAVCGCGARAVPLAFFDTDEVEVYMHCESCADFVAPIDWPFNEPRAYWQDFERLGFTVTN